MYNVIDIYIYIYMNYTLKQKYAILKIKIHF